MRLKIFYLMILVFLAGCQEKENGPLVTFEGVPGPLGTITVENLPGAAKISYKLPDDQDLLYVEAEYKTSQGEPKSAKSSVYKNFIMLEGFGDSRDYEVDLYTVNRSEERSGPYTVKIHPDTAPVHLAFETLEVAKTFGGVAISLKNELEREYIIHTLYKDSVGEWVEADRHYSSIKDLSYSVRGFEPKPVEFAFYMSDKWKNKSERIEKTITPLYEEEVDKSLWKNAELLDDFYVPRYGPLSRLWDGPDGSYFFQDSRSDERVMPNWITIDMGQPYILGRMKVNQVNHSNTWRYGSCSPRKFEVWGSNTPTTDWAAWDKLGTFESIKPSGLPVGQLSDDDLRVNKEGENFDFSPTEKSYRYIRFKTLETWGGTEYMCALELTLWGQKDN